MLHFCDHNQCSLQRLAMRRQTRSGCKQLFVRQNRYSNRPTHTSRMHFNRFSDLAHDCRASILYSRGAGTLKTKDMQLNFDFDKFCKAMLVLTLSGTCLLTAYAGYAREDNAASPAELKKVMPGILQKQRTELLKDIIELQKEQEFTYTGSKQNQVN